MYFGLVCKLTKNLKQWFRYTYQPQTPPSHLQDYRTCNSARWLNCFLSFNPNKWCLNKSFLSKGLKLWPLNRESTSLTRSLYQTCFFFSVIQIICFPISVVAFLVMSILSACLCIPMFTIGGLGISGSLESRQTCEYLHGCREEDSNPDKEIQCSYFHLFPFYCLKFAFIE